MGTPRSSGRSDSEARGWNSTEHQQDLRAESGDRPTDGEFTPHGAARGGEKRSGDPRVQWRPIRGAGPGGSGGRRRIIITEEKKKRGKTPPAGHQKRPTRPGCVPAAGQNTVSRNLGTIPGTIPAQPLTVQVKGFKFKSVSNTREIQVFYGCSVVLIVLDVVFDAENGKSHKHGKSSYRS